MVSQVGRVLAVHRCDAHTFSKHSVESVRLLAGLGVEGDAHAGALVKHRSRVAADPTQPNLRQVHLLHAEILDEANERGFAVEPGALGENLTTTGLDLHALPTGTVLRIGDQALVGLTGLRNPCNQINGYQRGLLDVVLRRQADGSTEKRGGVMAVVLLGGTVRPGDTIEAMLPPGKPVPLERV